MYTPISNDGEREKAPATPPVVPPAPEPRPTAPTPPPVTPPAPPAWDPSEETLPAKKETAADAYHPADLSAERDSDRYYRDAMQSLTPYAARHTMEDIYREANASPKPRYQDYTRQQLGEMRDADPARYRRLRREYRKEKASAALAALGDMGRAVAGVWGAHHGAPAQEPVKSDETLSGKWLKTYNDRLELRRKYAADIAAARQADDKQNAADREEHRKSVADIIKNRHTLAATENAAERLRLQAEKYAIDKELTEARSRLTDAQQYYWQKKGTAEEQAAELDQKIAEAQIALKEAEAERNRAQADYYADAGTAARQRAQADYNKAAAEVENKKKDVNSLVTLRDRQGRKNEAQARYYDHKTTSTGSLLDNAKPDKVEKLKGF